MPNGQTGTRQFADALHPTRVDRPQRFGDTPYTILDPGESWLRLDTRPLTVGVSTADQGWGPGDTYPFILGNNAAGFAHAFIGTGAPVNLWLFKVHARLVYGRLDQTAYSSMRADSAGARRFASGLIAIVEPRGMPGLEIGASRFFHGAWPKGGLRWSDLRAPLTQISKKSLIEATGDSNDVRNQLASVFFRWVLSRSGFELYAELGKDDHNWDLRDLILDPDHAAAHMFGFRKVWSTAPDRMLAVRGELIDLRFDLLTHTRGLGAGYYTNAELRQGHTERGQLLGADVPGGSGSGASIAVEQYNSRGRWTVEWRRVSSDTAGDYSRTGRIPARSPDVQHSLGVDVLVFGNLVDFHVSVTGVYDINRYFAADRFDLNAMFGSRWNW